MPLYLIELCKHFKVDYFVINDWDFETNELDLCDMSVFESLEELKANPIYSGTSNRKAMITTNWNLINSAGINNIHFNIKKLEAVIGYDSNDKNSLEIWSLINATNFEVSINLFPEKLLRFLNLIQPLEVVAESNNDLPF